MGRHGSRVSACTLFSTFMHARTFILVIAALFSAARGYAQAFGAAAEIQAPASEDSTATSTRVPVEGQSDIGRSLDRVPGANVLRTGGLGAFSGLSIRGSDTSHTDLYLDWLPISGPDTGAANLALVSLAGIDELRIYRGGAPAWLSSAAMGGVLQLRMPTRGARLGAETEVGSNGFVGVRVRARGGNRRLFVSGAASIERSDNDFRYQHDNATRFDPTDDFEARRENAEVELASGLLHLRYATGPHELAAVVMGVGRRGGAPGAGPTPALDTHQTNARIVGSLGYSFRGERGEFQLAAGGGAQRHRFFDPNREIGLYAEASDDRYARAFLRMAGTAHLLPWLSLMSVGTVTHDVRTAENALLTEAETSLRTRFSIGAEARLHGEIGDREAELRASARVEHSETIEVAGNEPESQNLPTFRLAGSLALAPNVRVVASLASGGRLPSIRERYGNRGTLLPSPGLRVESGLSFDAGVIAQGELGPLNASLEARGFHRSMNDLIRYRLTSQFTARAENITSATLTGAELGFRGKIGFLEAQASYTFLYTDAGDGLALHWRPQHQIFSELASAHSIGPVSIRPSAAIRMRGATYADPANLVELPRLTWVDLSLDASFHAFTARIQLRDVFDRRGQDFVGFPLPGRTLRISIAYQKDLIQ